MHTKHFIIPALVGIIALGGAGTAFAQEDKDTKHPNYRKVVKHINDRFDDSEDGEKRAVIGTISAINGDTLTMTVPLPGKATSTITVQVSSTTIQKELVSATGSKPTLVTQNLSDLAVGEHIAVRGERTNNTSIKASHVIELPAEAPRAMHMKQNRGIVGDVTDINGSTLTLKAMNGEAYTVNASAATVRDGTATSSLAHIEEGDRIAVHGKVDGETVTANLIMENIPDVPKAGKKDHGTSTPDHIKKDGMWGKFRGFFGKFFDKKHDSE